MKKPHCKDTAGLFGEKGQIIYLGFMELDIFKIGALVSPFVAAGLTSFINYRFKKKELLFQKQFSASEEIAVALYDCHNQISTISARLIVFKQIDEMQFESRNQINFDTEGISSSYKKLNQIVQTKSFFLPEKRRENLHKLLIKIGKASIEESRLHALYQYFADDVLTDNTDMKKQRKKEFFGYADAYNTLVLGLQGEIRLAYDNILIS